MTLSYDDAYGKNPLLDGMHKESSAGLSDEERESVIEKRFEEERQELQEVALRNYLDKAIKEPTGASLFEALSELTREALIKAGLRVGLDFSSSLSKQEMIDAICEVFSTEANSESSMEGLMSFAPKETFDAFCKVVDKGGTIVIPDDEASILAYPFYPPYVFVFWFQKDGLVVVAVMPEVFLHYKKLIFMNSNS